MIPSRGSLEGHMQVELCGFEVLGRCLFLFVPRVFFVSFFRLENRKLLYPGWGSRGRRKGPGQHWKLKSVCRAQRSLSD